MTIIGLIVIICIVPFIFLYFDKRSVHFNVKLSNECSEKKYYFDYENRKAYLHCIDSITIDIDGENYELKDAIEHQKASFSELLKKANRKTTSWDGGSVVYKFNDFTIIVYNRPLAGINHCNDIIIGTPKIGIEDYCN